MTAGTQLRIARVNRGLSLADAAAQLDIAESYLSMLERDRRRPSAPVAHRLISFYGLDAEVNGLWPVAA